MTLLGLPLKRHNCKIAQWSDLRRGTMGIYHRSDSIQGTDYIVNDYIVFPS